VNVVFCQVVFCDGPITRPEESYRVCFVSVIVKPWPSRGCCAMGGRGSSPPFEIDLIL
jgi:hypothetical protein